MRGFVGTSRDLPWTTTSPAFEDSKNSFYTYDLEKARSLAQQSGVSNPEFDIAWATAGFSAEYQQLAQIIQSDLAQIGVKTNLKPQEPPQFTAVGTAEPDANKRKQLYSQINDLLLDSAYCFTVSADANIMALRANVRGLRFEPSTFVTVREMWLA